MQGGKVSYDTLAIIVEQKNTMDLQKSMCGQSREDSLKEWFHKEGSIWIGSSTRIRIFNRLVCGMELEKTVFKTEGKAWKLQKQGNRKHV